MKTKRPSLFGPMKPHAAEPRGGNGVAELQSQIASHFEHAEEAGLKPPSECRRYPVASTRQGKRVTGVYLSDEALEQLKIIAARERKTIQSLMLEAVNGVFEARGLSRIA